MTMAPRTQTQNYVVLFAALLFAVNKASACSEFLVENVSDDRLTASSILNVSFSADKARLGSTGWVPDPNIHTHPWIQVDFGQPVTIMAVVTKGFVSEYYNGYVTKYILGYSNTTSSWNTVEDSTTHEFIGNSDHTAAVTNALPAPIVVRYLRLYPISFLNLEILRLDVIGCSGATDNSLTLNAQTNTIVSSAQPFSTTLSTSATPNASTILNISTRDVNVSSLSTSGTHTTTTVSLSSESTPTTSRTLASTLFNSSGTKLCTCACRNQTNVSLTPREMQTKIENIVQNLTVSKEKTSKFIRSKISAQDKRPEVVYVGSVAVALLCLMVGLVVLPDVCTVVRFFYSMLNK